tara:strand:- start:960 stop:1709 length:750 start_codon:yes stop_codon:yes gene_type:complete
LKTNNDKIKTTPQSIKLEDLYFSYGKNIIFENIDFELSKYKITCLLGISGIGKSTLLRCFAGLVDLIPPSKFSGFQEKPAYMGQQDNLLPWLNVLQNTLLGSKLRGEKKDVLKAMEILEKVGLEKYSQQKPCRLSGGQRQRVALARTLMENSSLVLMDEPFASLDALTKHKLQTLTAKLLQNKTVLLVTHDPLEALRLGHRIFKIAGNPAEIYEMDFPLDIKVPRDTSDEKVLNAQAKLLNSLFLDSTS